MQYKKVESMELGGKSVPGSKIQENASAEKGAASYWLFKNGQMQGAQVRGNEAYVLYTAMTDDAAQRSK